MLIVEWSKAETAEIIKTLMPAIETKNIDQLLKAIANRFEVTDIFEPKEIAKHIRDYSEDIGKTITDVIDRDQSTKIIEDVISGLPEEDLITAFKETVTKQEFIKVVLNFIEILKRHSDFNSSIELQSLLSGLETQIKFLFSHFEGSGERYADTK